MDKEIWKVIEGFPNYEVSNLGNVRNKETKRKITPIKGSNGYLSVRIRKQSGDYEKPSLSIHRLVAKAFVENPNDKPQVNHIDGNKTNNYATNLEWCTRVENAQHAMELGLFNPEPPDSPKRKVRIVETGEVFDSIRECAKNIGVAEQHVWACLNGRRLTRNDLHFEYADEIKPKRKPFLRDYQMEAVQKLQNGNILCGSVGSGKSRTGIFYYFKENGGWIDENGYVPMKNPQDLYIITTAKKRNSLEWDGELANFIMTTHQEDDELYNNKVVVDSWNNIGKYKDVEGAFFLLDEQRLVGNGAWVKSFLQIAKSNKWILLTATPGDTYMDYVPVFLANGFFKNRTEFLREHVVYSRFTKYPKVDRYINTQRLDRLRRKILVQMNYKHQINTHHEDIYCDFDIRLYKDVGRNRWNPYEDKPIKNASELCYVWRKIVNSDQSRQVKLLELLEEHDRVIVFYNHNYELDILRNMYYGDDVEVAEYNGQKHQPLPSGNKWVYLCQYNAAAEGWECTTTNVVIFFSQNYSYKMMTQAAGRVDRMNTPYINLYYYHLKSRSSIDLAISRALKNKKNFNEMRFVGKE